MHSIDHKRISNSFPTMLVNGVNILLRTSARTFGMGLKMFLPAGGIVTTRCTKRTNKTNNVLDFMEFRQFPSIASFSWKMCGDEVHQRTNCCFGYSCLTVLISDIPEGVLIKSCLKA